MESIKFSQSQREFCLHAERQTLGNRRLWAKGKKMRKDGEIPKKRGKKEKEKKNGEKRITTKEPMGQEKGNTLKTLRRQRP